MNLGGKLGTSCRVACGPRTSLKASAAGFTLVEIVIVLAIAGLILAIVFLAVTGAVRGRRDGERRNAVARLVAMAEQTASNSNGTPPANCAAVLGYNAGGYSCLDGQPSPNDSPTTVTGLANAYYFPGKDCTNTAALRVEAVAIGLEAGGRFCRDTK